MFKFVKKEWKKFLFIKISLIQIKKHECIIDDLKVYKSVAQVRHSSPLF